MVIWVVGGGDFGSRAAKFLSEAHPQADITLVDTDPGTLDLWQDRMATVNRDAVEFLVQNLGRPMIPDWIVAAVPVHLAWEWLIRVRPGLLVPRKAPRFLADRLPHPTRGPDGALYVSSSDMICPADCPEPLDVCPATGRPRTPPLFEVIAQVSEPEFETLVIPSSKLGPGVGGCAGEDFIRVRDLVQKGDRPLLLATACPCQGVIHCADRTNSGRWTP